MKLAVSNIAWPVEQRDAAYALLQKGGIRGLEIAPAMFLNGAADPFVPTEEEAGPALDAMKAAGLKLVSMQSLLFGVQGAALFEDDAARDVLYNGMLRAIGLAGRLSIPNLVFGSPRQRVIPETMQREEARDIACSLFRSLGDVALKAGCRIAIEPNPAAYGTNFLNRVSEALDFVEVVDHPGISLNLDIGAMHMNGDFDLIDTIAPHAGRVSHVHFSEDQLSPAPADPDQAARVMGVMTAAGYRGWYSIEMRTPPEKPLAVLERSIGTLLDAVERS
jgi:sugar phosphate isomerase/epimerase